MVRQCQRVKAALGGRKAGAFSLQPVVGAPGEGEMSGGLQLMKQGSIPCNHAIYSRCRQMGAGGAGNLVKYEEKLGQASIKD